MRPVLVLLVLVGCATTAPAPPAASPSPVVATYRGRTIRQAEVDLKAADELEKIDEQLYELRADTAERIALEALVAERAKAENLTEDGWLERELGRDLAPPTEAQLEAAYARVKSRVPAGLSYQDVRDQLAQLVENEEKASRAHALFSRLKAEAGFTLAIRPPDRPRKEIPGDGPSRGRADAPITIVEFADFECPYCARASATVERVLAAYPGQVRLVFRHFPLSFHPLASKAAEASACADQQGKFWEYHDALFGSQELELDALKAQAGRLGLDGDRFAACLDGGDMARVVKADMTAGSRAGVTGTPAFFINGLMLSGAQPEDAFRRVIDRELDRLAAPGK